MDADKTMFEVYREEAYSGAYRVVYFTELEDRNKEPEINRALAGCHFVDGFIRNHSKQEAKRIIGQMLDRMNAGELLSPTDFLGALNEHLA